MIGTYPGTHNLTLYRHPSSGALVFGAGTVFWVWGLDTNHDLNDLYPTAIDKNVQQACINLFADMGVQPASLIVSPGIALATISGDKLPPTSTITAPAPGSVKAQTPVTISGTSSDAGGGLVAGVEISTDNGLSWHPVTTTTADSTGASRAGHTSGGRSLRAPINFYRERSMTAATWKATAPASRSL